MKTSVLIAAFAALQSLPSWADTYSFAAVKDAGISATDVLAARYDYTAATFLSDSGRANASGDGNHAGAQTLPGINRIEVSNTRLVTDEHIRETGIGGPFAIALSGWTDEFTITGGNGPGKALISVNVSGKFGPGFGSGGGYGLWLSTPENLRAEVVEFLRTDPTAWIVATVDEPVDGGETLLIGYLAMCSSPGTPTQAFRWLPAVTFGGLFTQEISFVYGESFAIASVLYGSANDTGALSAMNSAHFGFSVLNNSHALVNTSSHVAYAAAVPEPATAPLVLAGLAALLGLAAKRCVHTLLRSFSVRPSGVFHSSQPLAVRPSSATAAMLGERNRWSR